MNIYEFQILEFDSTKKSDDTHVKITIRLVGDMSRDDPHYIQVFNIIMRKCLEHLKLQLVGRNYYDAYSKVSKSLCKYDCSLLYV